MPGPITIPASRTARGSMASSSAHPGSARTATSPFLVALLALTLLVGMAGAAPVRAGDRPTTTDPALAAAGWLADQVASDPALPGGILADAVLAFAAVGAADDASVLALSRLEAGLDAYISPTGTQRPGETGKALLAVLVRGADAAAFGGHDLEAELRAMLSTEPGPDQGRFGTATVIDQAYAMLALSRTPGGVPPFAVSWLAAAQCPSGEYQWDGSCPSAAGMEDSDTTALAAQALLASGETVASSAAIAWLLGAQDTAGGFPSFGTPNAGSSGLAAQAVRAAGETDAADAAAAFVASLQFGCDADPGEVGAIGWAAGIPGFLVYTAPSAMMAFGAPRMDQLSAEGASAEAPILDCPPQPAETPAATPAPTATPSPGAGQLPDTAAGPGPATGPTWLALLASALGWFALRRRRPAR